MGPGLLAAFYFLLAPPSSQLDQLLQAGDFEAAAGILGKQPGKAEDPQGRAETAILLAQCYLEMRLPQKVEVALRGCPQEYHSDPRYIYCKAEALAAKGDSQAAEKLLRTLSGDAAGLQVTFRLGVLLYEKGDYAGAEEKLRGPAGGSTPDYYSCIYRARALLALNRPMEGLEVLRSIGGKLETSEIKYLSGRCSYALGRYEPAAADFRLALKLDAGYIEAAFLLSESLRRAGDRVGAREALAVFSSLQKKEQARQRQANNFSQRCRREPGNISAWVQAGNFHLGTRDTDQASSHAWQALQLDPDSFPARLLLARSLRQAGRYSRAALHYRKILLREPGHSAANIELREMIRKHADK